MRESPEAPVRVALNVDEAAAAIGISSKSLRKLIAQGELRAARVGRRVLISVETLTTFVRDHEGNSS